eukprot:jgi/Mesen1/6032/ME000308S05218
MDVLHMSSVVTPSWRHFPPWSEHKKTNKAWLSSPSSATPGSLFWNNQKMNASINIRLTPIPPSFSKDSCNRGTARCSTAGHHDHKKENSFLRETSSKSKLEKVFRIESTDSLEPLMSGNNEGSKRTTLSSNSLGILDDHVSNDGGECSSPETSEVGNKEMERRLHLGNGLELPVFDVQWALLPGSQDMLHIFMPHYVHMFETVLEGPKPWQYAHVYVPADTNDGLNGAVGSLVEIKKVERFRDGRLLIVSQAVGRLRVTSCLQTVPFPKVEALLLPDEEEWIAEPDKLRPSSESERPIGFKDPVKLATGVVAYKLKRGERELWSIYNSTRELAGRLRLDQTIQPPPPSLVRLQPPGRGAGAPEDPAVVLQRVQELSYAVASVLPDLSRGHGRQRLLQAGSVCERLGMVTGALLDRRNELAARVAVRGVINPRA